MSVHKRLQQEHDTEYLSMLKNLVIDISTFANEQNKSGKKSLRDAFAVKTCDIGLDAIYYATLANDIYIAGPSSEQDYLLRREYLQRAKAAVKSLSIENEIYLNVLHNTTIVNYEPVKDREGNVIKFKAKSKKGISDKVYDKRLADVSLTCFSISKKITGVIKSDLEKLREVQDKVIERNSKVFASTYSKEVYKEAKRITTQLGRSKRPKPAISPLPNKYIEKLDPGYTKDILKDRIKEAIHFFTEFEGNYSLVPDYTYKLYCRK